MRAGADDRSPVFVGELGRATQYGQVQLRTSAAVGRHRQPVVARRADENGSRRRVDAIVQRRSPTRDRQPQTAFEQADQRIGEQVYARVLIEVERTAVGKQHLGPAARRPQPIAGQENDVLVSGLDAAVALEADLAIDDGKMRGNFVGSPLAIGGGSVRIVLGRGRIVLRLGARCQEERSSDRC